MIKAKNDEGWVAFSSDENTSYPPYLSVTYNVDASSVAAIGVQSNDTYYVINKNSKYALTANSLTANSFIKQQAFAESNLQAWKLVYSNGYYYLKCADSELCLSVLGNSTSNNSLVLLSSLTGADNQKWRIKRNWDGSYKIISKLGAEDKGLSILNATESNYVCQYTHTIDFSKEDDWTLIPTKKGSASAFGFTIDAAGIYTSHTAQSVNSVLSSLNYNSELMINTNAYTGYTKMKNSSIFHFSGHGFRTSALAFFDSNAELSLIACQSDSNVPVPTYGLKSLSSNSLKKLQLCVLSACQAGADETPLYDGQSISYLNFAGLLYQKGAHYVNSKPLLMYPVVEHDWQNCFYIALKNYDVLVAREFADNLVYGTVDEITFKDYGNFNVRHELGDTSIFLDYNEYSTGTSTTSENNNYLMQIPNIVSEKLLIESHNLSISHNGNMQIQLLATDVNDANNSDYNLYSDSYGNIYGYKNGSNILNVFNSNNTNELGNREVDSEKALKCADRFLKKIGIDVTNFNIEHSNNYSKNFKIEYTGIKSNEKILIYIKADDDNIPHVTFYKLSN